MGDKKQTFDTYDTGHTYVLIERTPFIRIGARKPNKNNVRKTVNDECCY